jgi:hypothetical protein
MTLNGLSGSSVNRSKAKQCYWNIAYQSIRRRVTSREQVAAFAGLFVGTQFPARGRPC